VVDGCGWVCTVLALRHLPVFVVQAVQGGAIALTAIGASVIWGSSLRTIDRVAVGACVAGLVLVSASAGSGRPATTAWVSTVVLVPTCAALVLALLALRSSGRAWPLAVIAGLGFGATSLAVRAIHLPAGHAVVPALLAQPATYLVVAFWWPMLTGLGIAVGGIATPAGSPTQRPPPPMIRLSRGPDVGDRWRGGGVS
jgi:hypothetical protein